VAFQPTPAQIKQFQALSPQEQKQLAESMGIEIPAGLSSGSNSASQANQQPVQTVEPRMVPRTDSSNRPQSPPRYMPDEIDGYTYGEGPYEARPDTRYFNEEREDRIDDGYSYDKQSDSYRSDGSRSNGNRFNNDRSNADELYNSADNQNQQFNRSNRSSRYNNTYGLGGDNQNNDENQNNPSSRQLNNRDNQQNNASNQGFNRDLNNQEYDDRRGSNDRQMNNREMDNQELDNREPGNLVRRSASSKQSQAEYELANLQPFGYDLFAGSPTTFAPVTDVPVPVDYVIGPGDTIVVQMYGKENSTDELVVSREGEIQFPEIGPVTVNGLNYGELKARINQLVAEQMIGVKASVTMGSLRSIRVFVLGEAYQPGSYTVSSLSTMTNALFASGGIKTIGSLRKIQLKRRGKVVSTLDLYDLLLNGNTANDKRLMPGDVLFIPTVKQTVSVAGDVRRPAIYELEGPTTAQEAIELAGGYISKAYPDASRIKRINSQGERTVINVDLSTQAGQARQMQDGDTLSVYSVQDNVENVVTLSGHLHRTGVSRWKKGLRVNDVIPSVAVLQENPDLTTAIIKRENTNERIISFKQIDLAAAIKGNTSDNILLEAGDEIITFEAGYSKKSRELKKLVRQLKNQTSTSSYPNIVAIQGEVKVPGEYPLTDNMTQRDLVRLAGGFTANAQRDAVLVAHQDLKDSSYSFEQASLLDWEEGKALKAYDQVTVLPQRGNREELLGPLLYEVTSESYLGHQTPTVSISGAVRYPGEYPFAKDTEVDSLIKLAGGLKEEAYLLEGEYTRTKISPGSEGFSVDHQEFALTGNGSSGLRQPLQPRDRVIIKQIPEWGESINVELNGEVRFPGIYPVIRGETLSDLITRAGGLTETADPIGAIFLRESLKEKEAEALTRFQKQLEEEAATVAAKRAADGGLADEEVATKTLLSQVKQTEALGRLVINLPKVMKTNNNYDIVMKDRDSITIPPKVQEVSILGEVNFPTSHIYEKGMNAGTYLNKSGGTTRKADVKQAYVISRDGSVRPMYKWRFLKFGMKRDLKAGDTLVVPTDIDRLHPLTVWAKVSQIVFQLATTAAALETVGAL